MALYPPILANSQDAFLAQSDEELIYFTLSNLTNKKDIEHIQIKIVYQSNNKSAASNNSPDGIVYLSQDKMNAVGNNIYAVPIKRADLEGGWRPNTYYKVQLCFGQSKLWTEMNMKFSDWKSEQIQNNRNSEWSTVMVLKALYTPEISIENQDGSQSQHEQIQESDSFIATVNTITPLFRGAFSCQGEPEDKFKFDLYQGDTLIETSDWQQHDNSGGVDSYRFAHILSNDAMYNVKYQVITVNRYTSKIISYDFLVNESFLGELSNNIKIFIDDEDPYANENGVLNIYLDSNNETVSGNYVLTRSDERSNFGVWEDIKFFTFYNDIFNNSLIYQDFTVDSGIKYKYAIQQQNKAGLRTNPRYEEFAPARMVNFQYSYLFADGVQLKLQFDNKVSSFKHTVEASKQNTLGSRYPTINRNGDAYYAEFPVTGLISLHMDNDETFFTLDNEGNYYFKGEKVINEDKHIVSLSTTRVKKIDTYDHNLTDNNYFIERKFREKVEEFLNDGNYKLYKSPTEGNFIVGLMNISFTPNETLGRLIFSFTATAYEIADNTLKNLNEYHIIDIGEFQESILQIDENGNPIHELAIGQIAGLFEQNTNLIDVIKKQSEYDIDINYQYKFEKLNSIQIEAYPRIKFDNQINELNVKIKQAETNNDEKTVKTLSQELKEVNALQEASVKQVAHPVITVYINDKEVSLISNRIYQLKDNEIINSIRLKYYEEPVIVNYTCYVYPEEKEETIISSITSFNAWGQIAGVFTNSENILENYVSGFKRFATSQISNEYNFNLYQSINIIDIIKENVRQYMEMRYNEGKYFDEYKYIDENNKEITLWTNGNIIYTFQKFLSIEIEADEGTSLLVTNMTRDTVEQEIIIGSSNKYRIEDFSNDDISIKLKEPQFLIVNYRCRTIQYTLGVAGKKAE